MEYKIPLKNSTKFFGGKCTFHRWKTRFASVEIVLYNSEKCTFHQWKMYFTLVEIVLSTNGNCILHLWKISIH